MSPGRDTMASAQPKNVRAPWRGEARLECVPLRAVRDLGGRQSFLFGQDPVQVMTPALLE